ncbi:unnamed protein product [Hanseniaspora opuntiae]
MLKSLSLKETFNNLNKKNGYTNVKDEWPNICKISEKSSLNYEDIIPYHFSETLSIGKIDEKLIMDESGKKYNSKYNTFTQYLLYCARNLIQKNDIKLKGHNTGSSIGTGIISIEDMLSAANNFLSSDPKQRKKVSPHFIPKILPNMAPSNLHINYKLQGPILTSSTACATGTQSIIDGYRYLENMKNDDPEIENMIVGASEASGHVISLAGFQRVRALSTTGVSRPFDTSRDGFVLSEGCGMMVLKIVDSNTIEKGDICIVGSGLTSDGYHLTSPLPDGDGGYRAMKKAMRFVEQNDSRDEINVYINCHATSTKTGDLSEIKAIIKLFSDNKKYRVFVASSKGALGHSLGASGAVECCVCYETLKTGIIHPTKNLQEIDPEIANILPENIKILTEREGYIKLDNIDYALNNSFGFGGVNSCLVLAKM